MASKKTYFIVRNTNYRPDGLIQLGQLIADPLVPYRRIAPPLEPLPKKDVHVSLSNNWSFADSKGNAREFGIFAHFVTFFTVETSARVAREFTQSWEASTLETTFLELGEDAESDYVTASIREAAVQKWLKRQRFPKKVVYIVTGIKVARSPVAHSYGKSRTTSGSAKVGVDPATGGLMSLGVQGGPERSKGMSESGTPCEDFVFAYRLRKVHISLRNKVSLGRDVGGAQLHRHCYAGSSEDEDEYSSEDDDDDELAMEETLLDVDDIEEVLVETTDFGPSLPVRDAQKEGVDEGDGGNCLVILAEDAEE